MALRLVDGRNGHPDRCGERRDGGRQLYDPDGDADRRGRQVGARGLSNAMRSPQHSDEKGPPSMTRAHVFSVAASRLGSITGMVIPIRTWAILACVSRRVIEARRLAAIAGAASPDRPTSAPRGTPRTACARTAGPRHACWP